MVKDTVIPLRCTPPRLAHLKRTFCGFAVVGGAADWLSAMAWLQAGDRPLLATAFYQVLDDGTLAIPLSIEEPRALLNSLSTDLPDVRRRAASRGGHDTLPDVPPELASPEYITPWRQREESMQIVMRTIQRTGAIHRIACGLLFDDASRQLLIGTDPLTLALVVTTDVSLIIRYLEPCLAMPLADYVAAFGSGVE